MLKWNSSNLEIFLEYSTQQVKNLDLLLFRIKNAVKIPEAIFHQLEHSVMFDRKDGRAVSFQELSTIIQDHISRRHAAVSGKNSRILLSWSLTLPIAGCTLTCRWLLRYTIAFGIIIIGTEGNERVYSLAQVGRNFSACSREPKRQRK